jgi:hypothetical protein
MMTSFARVAALLLGASAPALLAATPATVGPFNTEIAAGGQAYVAKVGAPGVNLPAAQSWTLQGWVDPHLVPSGTVTVAGVGAPGAGLFLALVDGAPALVTPAGIVKARDRLPADKWSFVAATADKGVAHLYVDGQEAASGPASAAQLAAEARMGGDGFGGRVAGFGYTGQALSAAEVQKAAARAPDPTLTVFTLSSPTWPVQVRQMQGQVTPQPAWTLPKSGAPYQKPVAKPEPKGPALAQRAANLWTVAGWHMAEGSKLRAPDGAAISQPGFGGGTWYAATVPGTALTTLVDRGVYPDPAYGLNNLAIPESLAHQDYWYRTEIEVPADLVGKHLALTFNGANYAAEIWVNGARVGAMKGAFIRGRFDVTGKLVPGKRNAIAVRVSPPPHPGVTSEESLTSGVGENGGMMMLDGPTFEATEGWDWIPTVRDRNTGLWQGVDLSAAGDIQIGDAQVITHLPRGSDTSIANITIEVPLHNVSDHAVTTTLTASFDDVRVDKSVTVNPGTTLVRLTPADFPQLAVHNPKLWWPNNYGAPNLHMLHLSAGTSDMKDVRFGMREVTYELSLMDHDGALERVLVDPTAVRDGNRHVIDHRHSAIREVPKGWAYSFAEGGEKSPAVTPIEGDEGLSPFLVLRVNGVRIAARGGSIGMDDFMKRVSRERQEPYFKLHRDAHLNIIRNWMGQDTGENFYALADEYGLMVFNDFWESTQDYNIEAEDVPLFLANVKDVLKRYRNHPSIVVWVPRNEGVPQPILNEGIEKLIEQEDGTRLYMASSNRISLQNSGPYNWRKPVEYFTEHAKGFSVELGTPSFPTLESWKRTIPAPDLWPISDVWAYHDWHQTGNGAVASYMKAMDEEFGPATSLEDFERKAQMLEYVSYRAILEGFNAGLWKTNSARMFWMTQPAWPSSAWQIFSSDYDTHAAFYGTKKASEPVHVQMNLPDFKVIVVNNGRDALAGATVHARVTTLDNKLVAERSTPIAAGAGLTADAFTLDLAPALNTGVVLVALDVTDASGKILSRNVYWQGRDEASYRAMDKMPQVRLTATAASRTDGADRVTSVDLTNPSHTAAMATKLTLFGANGAQVLPALFTDNYVSLMPGATRHIEIRYPTSAAAKGPVTVRLRGWNIAPLAVKAK